MRRGAGIAALAGLLLVSGCALGPDTVAIHPAAVAPGPALVVSGPVALLVVMAPGVPADRVGWKKNAYDMETGVLHPDRPVPVLVADALEAALRARGVAVQPAGRPMRITVDRFENVFSPGVFSSDTDATVALDVTVNGRTLRATGSSHRDGLWLMTPGVARRALDRALADAIDRLLADPGFRAALAASG